MLCPQHEPGSKESERGRERDGGREAEQNTVTEKEEEQRWQVRGSRRSSRTLSHVAPLTGLEYTFACMPALHSYSACLDVLNINNSQDCAHENVVGCAIPVMDCYEQLNVLSFDFLRPTRPNETKPCQCSYISKDCYSNLLRDDQRYMWNVDHGEDQTDKEKWQTHCVR